MKTRWILAAMLGLAVGCSQNNREEHEEADEHEVKMSITDIPAPGAKPFSAKPKSQTSPLSISRIGMGRGFMRQMQKLTGKTGKSRWRLMGSC